MTKKELLQKLIVDSPLTLAFIGDSVHTLYVREKCLEKMGKMANYHTLASRYCKASCQAKVLERIKPKLNEEETDIVRRARNAKPKHKAKNASGSDYQEATSFEALIGFLYLSENEIRLNEILQTSIED